MKLTKEQLATKAQLGATLRTTGDEYVEAVNDANEQIKTILANLEGLRSAYLGAVEDANNFMAEVRDNAQETYDEKPEKWQESDKGTELQNFIDAWDTTLNEPDPLPELDIDTPEPEADSFDELPEES